MSHRFESGSLTNTQFEEEDVTMLGSLEARLTDSCSLHDLPSDGVNLGLDCQELSSSLWCPSLSCFFTSISLGTI